MIDEIMDRLKQDTAQWNNFSRYFQQKEFAPKTTLLREGDTAKYIFFIKKGCLRLWFNNDGKDITLQFFFEGQAVSSFDSFLHGQPSMFSLESIEPAEVVMLSKEGLEALLSYYPEMRDGFYETAIQVMSKYIMLFLSVIKDNPGKRYENLLAGDPRIIQRVPQHYIASYLGITPVSLSRIRNKK